MPPRDRKTDAEEHIVILSLKKTNSLQSCKARFRNKHRPFLTTQPLVHNIPFHPLLVKSSATALVIPLPSIPILRPPNQPKHPRPYTPNLLPPALFLLANNLILDGNPLLKLIKRKKSRAIGLGVRLAVFLGVESRDVEGELVAVAAVEGGGG